MIVFYFFTGALALLIALLLLGFVGCDVVWGLDHVPYADDYPTAIKNTPDLVAYWRLGEPNPSSFPTSGGYAHDEQGLFHGDYFVFLANQLVKDTLRHSPGTNGVLALGAIPGLLERKPADSGLALDGGYVQIPFADPLNPPQFTFEAWVFPDATILSGFYYCLAESTGPAGPNSVGPKKTGWGLYLGPENPATPGPPVWQVWMGDGTKFTPVLLAQPFDGSNPAPPNAGPPQTLLTLTYLALTFDGSTVQLWLYYPDHMQQVGLQYYQANQATVTTFQRNDASINGKGDFFIGSGSNLFPPPQVAGNPAHRLYPFKGKIQEAALYSSDLSIYQGNPGVGVQQTIIPHVISGGNL
jgi:hypothetical protein